MQKTPGRGRVRGFEAFAKRGFAIFAESGFAALESRFQRPFYGHQATWTKKMDQILRQNSGDGVESSVEPTILRRRRNDTE